MRFAKKKKTIYSLLIALFLVIIVFYAWPGGVNAPGNTSAGRTGGTASPASFNKHQYPVDEASSLWVIVNKGRQLPSSYAPADLVVPNVPLRLGPASQEMHLRSEAATALEQMTAAAKFDSIGLMLSSGYRSYNEQISLYGSYVKSSGAAAADTYSARPGYSEHQTGLAADLEPTTGKCDVDQCFAATPEGQWLAANAYKFGFIIRYPKGDDSLTG
ncbi:MAG TPA: M15 family metallopeptidase [Candidatus Saccharimonadales bacterium]|nr:M15 family metallopeptidase [Candidatus Saccharimonadales bacterium]